MNRFSPLVGTQDCYVLHGHDTDAFVSTSKAEVEREADALNDRQTKFAVVLLSADGHWTDVTEEFWRAAPDYVPEYEEPRPGFHTRMMRRTGAFA